VANECRSVWVDAGLAIPAAATARLIARQNQPHARPAFGYLRSSA